MRRLRPSCNYLQQVLLCDVKFGDNAAMRPIPIVSFYKQMYVPSTLEWRCPVESEG